MYAGCVKLYAKTLEIFTHAVFHLVVAHKTASSDLQGAKEMEGEGCQIGTEEKMRT
jgi:hypothetical protein